MRIRRYLKRKARVYINKSTLSLCIIMYAFTVFCLKENILFNQTSKETSEKLN